ncbi:hypothetical protein F4801DRAFT_599856 [Xylaria longipes]|nr:hypothetical protein F4801DRAFT_599856 [Xylaria longipes]
MSPPSSSKPPVKKKAAKNVKGKTKKPIAPALQSYVNLIMGDESYHGNDSMLVFLDAYKYSIPKWWPPMEDLKFRDPNLPWRYITRASYIKTTTRRESEDGSDKGEAEQQEEEQEEEQQEEEQQEEEQQEEEQEEEQQEEETVEQETAEEEKEVSDHNGDNEQENPDELHIDADSNSQQENLNQQEILYQEDIQMAGKKEEILESVEQSPKPLLPPRQDPSLVQFHGEYLKEIRTMRQFVDGHNLIENLCHGHWDTLEGTEDNHQRVRWAIDLVKGTRQSDHANGNNNGNDGDDDVEMLPREGDNPGNLFILNNNSNFPVYEGDTVEDPCVIDDDAEFSFDMGLSR